MASLSFGSFPRARATRTCSRAAPGESPARQLSHCAHDRQPSQPSRSSNSRMRTSISWVAAWMPADSSAMRSPSRASCTSRSPGAVAGSRRGESSGGGGCVWEADGTEPSSAGMSHCNPLYFNGLQCPRLADRRPNRSQSRLGGENARGTAADTVTRAIVAACPSPADSPRRGCQVQNAGRARNAVARDHRGKRQGALHLAGCGDARR